MHDRRVQNTELKPRCLSLTIIATDSEHRSLLLHFRPPVTPQRSGSLLGNSVYIGAPLVCSTIASASVTAVEKRRNTTRLELNGGFPFPVHRLFISWFSYLWSNAPASLSPRDLQNDTFHCKTFGFSDFQITLKMLFETPPKGVRP